MAHAYNLSMQPLQDAVLKNDVAAVGQLIHSGVDIDGYNVIGLNNLHVASINGFVDVAKELLQGGCSVDMLTKFSIVECTALHLAASKGHSELVKLLLEAGADINCMDSFKRTSLHVAAEYGHLLTVKIFIEYGALVDYPDENNFTALHYAASQGHDNVVQFLVSKGSNKDLLDTRMQLPIHHAALGGQENTVKYLFTLGASSNANLYDLLVILMSIKKFSMARTVLEYKQQTLKSVLGPKNLLLYFITAENINLWKLINFLIMDLNEDINGLSLEGESVLEVACKHCNVNIIVGLLDYDYDVNIRSTQVVDIVMSTFHYKYREALVKHCVRLSVVRPDWSWPEAYWRLIDCNNKEICVKTMQKECSAEVVKLSMMKIGVSYFTMFDILVGSTTVAFMCVNIVGTNMIQEIDFDEFPIYGGMVHCKLKRVFRRVMLINMLRNDCLEPASLLNLPEIPLQKIIKCLSNEDLEMLVKATHNRVPLSCDISEFF